MRERGKMSSQQELVKAIKERFAHNRDLIEVIVSCGGVTPSGTTDPQRKAQAVLASDDGMVASAIVGRELLGQIAAYVSDLGIPTGKAAIALYAQRQGKELAIAIAVNRVGEANEPSYKVNGATSDSFDIEIYDYPQTQGAVIDVLTNTITKGQGDPDRSGTPVPLQAIPKLSVMARNTIQRIITIDPPTTQTIRKYGRGGN